MKNANNICSQLGITQNNLAMLLGASRNQCAMFETGQRDLPCHAKQVLSELLTHMQSFDATKSKGGAQKYHKTNSSANCGKNKTISCASHAKLL